MKITGMTTSPEAPAKTLTQLVALEVRLELVRQDRNQSELARSIGKNEQWLSVRLRGRQPIDVNDLALIARGLGVGIHQLLPEPEAASTVEVFTPKPKLAERPSTRHDVNDRPRNRQPDGGPRRRTSRVPRPGKA